MGARTGQQFLSTLRKTRRTVWLGDERVDDVTAHPALAGAAQTLARVFDRQHRYAEDCLVADPATGQLINISHAIPHSVEDLKRRNPCISRISEATVGMMGRTPDYMNVKFACFAATHAIWAGPHVLPWIETDHRRVGPRERARSGSMGEGLLSHSPPVRPSLGGWPRGR